MSRPIEAADHRSAEILDLAARALGNTDNARTLIQNAYNLGRVDGRLGQIEETLGTMKRASTEPVPA